MKRRQFIQSSTFTLASFTIAACTQTASKHFSQPAVKFGKLEKTDLTIGYLSTLDLLPLAIAQEQGLFKKYGLNVTLVKQPTWEKLQQELSAGKLDAAQTLFAMPLWAYFSEDRSAKQEEEKDDNQKKGKKAKPITVALMGTNINGNSISWGEAAWKAGMRPHLDYNTAQEVADGYNKYLREVKTPPSFAISHPASMANYTTRYWLGSIGIDAERYLNIQVLEPKEISAGLKSGKIAGYATDELFNQKAIADKQAFTTYIDRDIWRGHPEKVLATLDSWLEDHPNTAKAMMAAVLEGCQFCEHTENNKLLAPSLAKGDYVESGLNQWKSVLAGNYNYGGLDGKARIVKTPDFQIFHSQPTNYLKAPNHANFLWHSHAVWVLTQMVRWHQLKLTDYPKNADVTIKKLYPTAPYGDVAKAFGLNLPKGFLKLEAAGMFIDRLAFDPNQPIEYLNNFELRAGRPQLYGLS
jgi:nitrate/nitrite transport system substrate-binding protein